MCFVPLRLQPPVNVIDANWDRDAAKLLVVHGVDRELKDVCVALCEEPCASQDNAHVICIRSVSTATDVARPAGIAPAVRPSVAFPRTA